MKRGILVLIVLILLTEIVFALEPCQSGGLTTSTHKNYQMLYPNEDFIQINNLDLLKDTSQLKDLTCLQYMDATDRTIKGDISSLKNLVNLEVFSLYSNPEVYGDICSLSKAIKLRSLKFAFDPNITGDVSCLKDMTKLETFAMTHTQISGDLSVFSNMPNLKAIYVSGTNIKGNICALSNLTNLEELGIADEYPGNPDITGDLSCLDNLKKLKRVSIYNTGTTNCEQFTNSHPNIAQMGETESGRPAGGGCSKESLKTLVDVAQKYERKIGKEVQTEVRGKPNYNPNTNNVSAGIDNEQITPANKNFIKRFFSWIKNLFGKKPTLSSMDNNPSVQSDERSKSTSNAPDEGPPKECTVNGKFIGKDKCRAMMESSSSNAPNAPDEGPPKECIIDGKFIGESQCKAMMEKTNE